MIAQLILLLVLPALLVAAGTCDLASYTIPNRIQIALIAAFAAFALTGHLGTAALGGHLLAALIGLVAGIALFALGYVGGGDAKLFACIGLWLGLNDLMAFALLSSVLGGFLTLGLLAARRLPLPAVLAHQDWIMRLHAEDSGIPYGVALATGALVLLPYSEIFRLGLSG